MRHPLIRFLLLALLALPCTVMSQSLDRDTVLRNLIDSYGGQENLHKLDNAVQEWDMVALMSKRHGTDVRHIRLPDQLMVKLTYPEKVEKRELYGNEARVIFDGGQPIAATPAQRDAMRLQLMRLYSPLVLREKSEAVTLTVEGDLCALTLVEHGVQADYLVNMDNWRIEIVVGSLNVSGTRMQFRTEYSDFERIQGVLVHRKENKFAGSVNTAMLSLRKITFNAGLDEDSFSPENPEKSPEPARSKDI